MNEDIIIELSDVNLDEISKTAQAAVQDREKLGPQVKATGEFSRMGGQVLSKATEEVAESFGLPPRIADSIGNQIENLVMGMGAAALGVGAAVVAVSAAILIAQKLASSRKEHREDLASSVSSLRGEVEALYNSTGQSRALKEATYRLTIAKRDLLRVEISQLIKSLTKEIAEERASLVTNSTMFKKAWDNFTSLSAWMGDTKTATQQRNDYIARQTERVGVLVARKKEYEAALNRISGTIAAPSMEEAFYPIADRMSNAMEQERALIDLQRAQGLLSMEALHARELALFEQGQKNRIEELRRNAAEEKQIIAIQAIQKIEKAVFLRTQEHRAYQVKANAMATVLGDITQAAGRSYGSSESLMTALYYIARAADAVMAFYNYYSRAKEAYGYEKVYWYAMMILVPACILAMGISGRGARDPSAGLIVPRAIDPRPSLKYRQVNIIINGKHTESFDLAEADVRQRLKSEKVVDEFLVTAG